MKVLLVDDNRLMLEGLQNLLAAHQIDVVGTTGDGTASVDPAGGYRLFRRGWPKSFCRSFRVSPIRMVNPVQKTDWKPVQKSYRRY
ncbi:MAG: hypothetical protein RQ739_08790 [Desulfotignum sp.]|nr:hypothetical protein [Desulfotignum sp.]